MGKAFNAYRQSQSPSEGMAAHLPMVRRIAGKLASRLPSSVDVNDLIQAGCEGLVQAWARFSQDAGPQFEAFASSRVRGAMLDWLRSEDLLPKAARAESKRLDSAAAALRHELGRAPREDEIAERVGMSLPEYQESMASFENSRFLSLDDMGLQSPEDFIAAAPGADPFEQLLASQTAHLLTQAIEELPERERLVLSLHHEQELTFKEIAQILELSEARVCQLHGQCLSRIRGHLAKRSG